MNHLEAYLQSVTAADRDRKTKQKGAQRDLYREAMGALQEPYKQAIVNIGRSEALRREINAAIAGGDTHKALDKALECIALMTGDQLFYTLNKRRLKDG